MYTMTRSDAEQDAEEISVKSWPDYKVTSRISDNVIAERKNTSGEINNSILTKHVKQEGHDEYKLSFNAEKLLRIALSYTDHSKRKNLSHIGERLNIYNEKSDDELAHWQKFINNIHTYRLHADNDESMAELLLQMQIINIANITEMDNRGTEFKFAITLLDGTPIISKPQRLDINIDAPHNMSKNDFYERFQSEVAAFHLSRILGFNFVPPVVSRYINLDEIYHISPHSLRETFFRNSDGNICFTGHCSKKCTNEHAICGQPNMIASSFALLLPSDNWVENPAHDSSLAYGRKHTYFCQELHNFSQITSNPAKNFLDIIDLNIFDFIQGNLDRHHFGKFKVFGDIGHMLLFDNGRGFTRHYQDEFAVLMPLQKCCRIRLSTMQKLLQVYDMPGRLSEAMRISLQSEAVKPLLTEKHLEALNRRLIIVLEKVYGCLDYQYDDKVIIDDGF